MKTKLLFGLFLLTTLQFTNAQFANIGFLGNFSGWGTDINMSTADGVTYTKLDYCLPNTGLKFRQDDAWTNSWGGDTFPSGTTTSNDIPVTSGFYDINFNLSTGDYTFTTVPGSNQHVSIIGDFNSWSADVTLATTDNINYSISNVAISGAVYKFRRDANWAVGYGDSGTPGTASPSGGNITAPTPGNYDFTINIKTLAYTVTPTSTLAVDEFTKNG